MNALTVGGHRLRVLGTGILTVAALSAGCSTSPSSTPTTPPATTTDSAPTTGNGDATATEPEASTWDEIVEAAKAEGEVVFYSSLIPATNEAIAAAFMERYPEIRVETLRDTGGALISRMDQERETGVSGADVAIITEAGWLAARAEAGDLTVPIGPASQEWPAEAGGTPGQPWILPSTDIFVIGVNTELVDPDNIVAYDDLLDPAYRGLIGAVELVSANVIHYYDFMESTYGPGFLESLADQDLQLYGSAVPMANAVAAGEVAIAAYGVPAVWAPLIDSGAPVTYIVPEQSAGLSYSGGALAYAARPNAAQVFLDFVQSLEGQTVIHSAGLSYGPLDVAGQLEVTGSAVLFDPTRWTQQAQDAFRSEWGATFAP